MKTRQPHRVRRSASFILPGGRMNAWVRVAVIGTAMMTTAAAFAPDDGGSSVFQAQLHAAMTRMMDGMETAPSGDVDTDFVTMMEPHHQGAIDMAIAELRYGKNTQLRRIAQEIIIDQQQEIAAMRMAIGRPIPPSAPAPTAVPLTEPVPPHSHHGASTK